MLAPSQSWVTPRVTTTRLRSIHGLLTVQSVVIILLSINRLSSLTVGYVAANEFLRWVDLNNMLILPLISLVAFYGVKKVLEYDGPQREGIWHRTLSVLFVVGVYLTGAGYGDHEVTNYLHTRFCIPDDGSALCRIIIFNDDEFSHWLFFAGFVLTNVALMLLQTLFPQGGDLARRDLVALVANGLLIGLGVFANLAFEEIGLDLYIVALLALLAVGLLWQWGRQPLLVYYTTAYVFGLVATAVVKVALG
jgi:hypothetical protein